MNDIIWRSLSKAGFPSIKEPQGLLRTDGKRPDGLTLIPWQNGRCATWDVTVTDTVATSYLSLTSSCAGSAAEAAATRKEIKYAEISSSYHFFPSRIWNFWSFKPSWLWLPFFFGPSSYSGLRWSSRIFLPFSAALYVYSALQRSLFLQLIRKLAGTICWPTKTHLDIVTFSLISNALGNEVPRAIHNNNNNKPKALSFGTSWVIA